jgi:hypothetical protein
LMLASTMQFSRYGRPRDKTRPIQGGPSRTTRKQGRQRPFPQDPTACQATSPPPLPFRPGGRTD